MPDPFPLSPAGEDRRAEILRLAQVEARRRRRRRHTFRAMAVGALVVVVLAVMLTHRRTPPRMERPVVILPAPTTRPVVAVVTPPPIVAPRPKPRQIVIQFIKTEPDLARRMAVAPQKPTWQRLSDDELIEELADAGHPAGLAWVDGREFILYRPADRRGDSHPGKIVPPR